MALSFILSPYVDLVVQCGAFVSGGDDVADIPRQWLLGSVIIGTLWILLANGFVAFVQAGRQRQDREER